MRSLHLLARFVLWTTELKIEHLRITALGLRVGRDESQLEARKNRLQARRIAVLTEISKLERKAEGLHEQISDKGKQKIRRVA